jgi:hypothetical protein
VHDDPLPPTQLDWTVQGRTYRVTAAMLDRNAKAVQACLDAFPGSAIAEIRPASYSCSWCADSEPDCPMCHAADDLDSRPSPRSAVDPAPVGGVVRHPDPRDVRQPVARSPGRARPGRVPGSGGGGADGEDTGQLSLFGGVRAR